MESLQVLAGKIFNDVGLDKLSIHHANAMGFLIDEYGENEKFSSWIHDATEQEVIMLLNCLVKHHKWGNTTWLNGYIVNSKNEFAA